jgi:hypothetical protein
VSDPIFQEIDEEVRREKLKQIWERYGTYFIAAAFVLVLAVAGWRGYQWWQARLAARAGGEFESAVTLLEKDKYTEAQQAFAKIAQEAPSGYRMLARLREAAALAQHDPKAAVQLYDQLSSDSSLTPELRDLARLRAGMLLANSASYDELVKRLEPLTGPDATFRHTAREVLAFSAWRSGDKKAATKWIDMIVTDAQTPASTRSRIEMLMALTGANNAKAKG